MPASEPNTHSTGPPPPSSSSSSSSTDPHHPPASAPDTRINPTTSIQYWTSTPATQTGMLGGYPQISRIDLQGSKSFLTKLRRGPAGSSTSSSSKRLQRGVDCGAGIGRVTDGFLKDVCEVVDLVEPVGKFAEVLRRQSGAAVEGRVGQVLGVGLQDWDPTSEGGKKYDLIWNQWCLGHLTDEQLTAYLRRCARVVRDDGWIVVKENMSTDPEGGDIFDEVDSSVTRTDEKFRGLFAEAGLRVVREEAQKGFPRGLGLYPVRMYGLRPVKGGKGDEVGGEG